LKLTAVIPAHNEEAHLAACLAALARQQTTHELKVIVVDNASTDRTAAVANSFAGKLDLNVLSEPTPSRGRARAAGFATATTDIILSTDADTVVPPDWAAKLVAALTAVPGAVAVTGTCRITDCAPRTNRAFNWFQPNMMRLYRLIFGHYWLTGSNFAIYRNAYLKAGGFNPAAAQQEDIEFGFRLKRVGRIVFAPGICVTTTGNRFKHGLLRGLWHYVHDFFARVLPA